MVAQLPKAELHCHIEGAASPRLVAELADHYGTDISGVVRDGRFVWDDFSGFLAVYDRVASLFRSEDDYRLLAREYLMELAEDGAIYTEIFVSPDHALKAGLSPAAYVDALAAGMRDAEVDGGIVSRMVVVGVRHFGRASVEAAARFAAFHRHPWITGFGLAGDERVGTPKDLANAFDIARDAGLGLTAHAGEFCGPEAISATLDHLKPTRIGHGVRAIEDRSVLRRLVEEGVTLEICVGSNLALGIYPDLASHPLKDLLRAGCRVTLGADDPPFFGTSLSGEYAFAAAQGLSAGDLLAMTRHAIDAAFIDPETRQRLRDRLVVSALSLGAPGDGA